MAGWLHPLMGPHQCLQTPLMELCEPIEYLAQHFNPGQHFLGKGFFPSELSFRQSPFYKQTNQMQNEV